MFGGWTSFFSSSSSATPSSLSTKGESIGMDQMAHFVKNFVPVNTTSSYYIISTLQEAADQQKCLIKHTLTPSDEVNRLNECIQTRMAYETLVIIYGKNAYDTTVQAKQRDLHRLGFQTLVYRGGLFEWLLLQELVGNEDFPTTSVCEDLFQYR